MNKIQVFLLVLIFIALSFTIGYRIGDANGYTDGYKTGYLYDCKEEIGLLHEKVLNQGKALKFTDSSIRAVMHENDSLKRKEYYIKRHTDSLSAIARYSQDSAKYYRAAKIYADSLNKAVGGSVINIIQPDGNVNRICILLPKYRDLPECQDGFDIRSRLENKLKKKKGRKKK